MHNAFIEKKICENCGREITLVNYNKHYKACINPNSFSNQRNLHKNTIDYSNLICKYCNKTCKNKNSLVQHELRCKENPNRLYRDISENLRKCQGQNKGKILITNGIHNKLIFPNEEIPDGWHKGSCTKGKTSIIGYHHTEEMKKHIGQKMSEILKEGYASGKLKPNKGIGRGKYSYFTYKDKTYLLRSTYEFIFALYLAYNNIDFEYEAIRVPAIRKNQYSSTFISDFNIDNHVIEVKGIKSSKDTILKESFEAAGYQFTELFIDDILKIQKLLEQAGYDVEFMIKQIKLQHKTKNYFQYVFNNKYIV